MPVQRMTDKAGSGGASVESVTGVFVPVNVLAEEQGVSVETIIERIRTGDLVGRTQNSEWHVLVQVPGQVMAPDGDRASLGLSGAAPSGVAASGDSGLARVSGPVTLEGRPEVIVRDVHIGFASLIWLIIKFVAALAIAVVILGGIGFGVVLLIENFGRGLIDNFLQLIGPYLP